MKPHFAIMMLLPLLAGCAVSTVSPAASIDPAPALPAMAAPVRFYQRYLSGADGGRCPMTPSCSGYALAAMQRHGTLMGWIMTCDRLMRCGRDELATCPTTPTSDGPRCRDSVDNNDFWFP